MHQFNGYQRMMGGGWSWGFLAIELLLIGIVVYIKVKIAMKVAKLRVNGRCSTYKDEVTP